MTRTVHHGAVEYRFRVDDSGDVPQHEYLGDEEAPADVLDELDAWIAAHHDVDGEGAA